MGTIWVDNKRELIFIGIPKNASTSIRNVLGNKRLPEAVEGLQSKEEGYKSFAIVRDPLTRLVSGYFETLKRKESQCKSKPYFKLKPLEKSFEQFISDVEENFFDNHIKPQSVSLLDNDGKFLNIDYLIDFDNIEKDLDRYDLIDRDRKLNKSNSNRSQPNANKVLAFLEEREDLKKRIEKLYEKDFYIYNKLKEGLSTNEIKKEANGAGWNKNF